MPSKKPKIVIHTEQITIDKLDIIAKNQNRSRANIAETIIKTYIEQYERQNGNISVGDISINSNNGNISIGSNNISGGTNNINIG